MKDLIFVTAYCPTEKQEQLLEKCVDSVINCGFHVALISHSHVPIHIQKKCHYYVYDYNNDISNEHSLLGHDHFIFSNKRIQSKFFSKTFYGFAIYRMFSIISQIAINFKYENIHHIEYDCELLDKNLIIENAEHLKEYDSIIHTDSGDEYGFLFGSFKSFKVKSLPDKFKNYDREFIETEMKNLKVRKLEFLTKHLFIESGKVLYKKEPTEDKFKRGVIFEHRNLNWTLYYNPENKNLNIFYNTMDFKDTEKIVIIINNQRIVQIQTEPRYWYIRELGIFDDIKHIRVDNGKKIIFDKSFDDELRQLYKNESHIFNI